MPSNRNDPGQGSGPARYSGSFLLAFREAVSRLGWDIHRWLGGAVECRDAQGQEKVIGLENLYRRARREDRALWPDLIAEFLQSVSSEQWENPPTELAAVTEQLLVRLGPPLVQKGEMQFWNQPLVLPDLVLNLVIDYPQSMSYVSAEMVEASGTPGNDWIQRALRNLAARTPADCLPVVDADSGLRLCTVGDAYDSSRALLLDQLLPETAADGQFVAIPGRDELLVLPVAAAGIAHLHLLKALANKNFKTAPYPISDQVFWVHGGQWFWFPIEMKGEKVTVQPPPEFLEVLQRLAGEEEEEKK